MTSTQDNPSASRDPQDRRPSADTFHQRRADAALKTVTAEVRRNGWLSDIVLGKDSRRDIVDRVVEVVPADDAADPKLTGGAYVVQVVSRQRGDTTYATVLDGTDARLRFASLDVALLHLVARRNGGGDTYGSAAFYAARVLGIDDPR